MAATLGHRQAGGGMAMSRGRATPRAVAVAGTLASPWAIGYATGAGYPLGPGYRPDARAGALG